MYNQDDPSKASSYPSSILKNISWTKDLGAVKSSELVLEVIIESIEIKQKLFQDVEKV